MLSILMIPQLCPAGFLTWCLCRLCTLQLAHRLELSLLGFPLQVGDACTETHMLFQCTLLTPAQRLCCPAGGMGSSMTKHSTAEWQLPPWPARNCPRAPRSARARRSASCLTSRSLPKGELQSRLRACTARTTLSWHANSTWSCGSGVLMNTSVQGAGSLP